MPEIVSLSDRAGYFRIRSSPKYSSALLNVDFKQDTSLLVFELLRDICNDYALLSRERTQPGSDQSKTHAHVGSADPRNTVARTPTDPKHLIVARLNVLVLLSKRVFLWLDVHKSLHRPVIEAVYYVLRLVIWSPNRSLRCAALRCLRYYVRTALDLKLLLEQRADLLIARCLDLSYLPEEVKDRGPVNFSSSKLNSHYPIDVRVKSQAVRNPVDEPACQRSPSGISPPIAPSQTPPIINPSFVRNSTRIHPRLRSRVPQYRSGARYPSDGGDSTSSVSPPGCLPTSPLVSALGERQLFLRLTYHLVRIAPHLFPISLVQAVAAPCLRAGRFQSAAGGVDSTAREPRSPHRAAFPDPNMPGPIGPGRHVTVYDGARAQPEEANPITSDLALRSCLLILTELIILAPDHVARMKPTFTAHSSLLQNSVTLSDTGHQFQSTDSVIVQALMSAFASCPTRKTIHPARIQQAVLLALLSLLNHVNMASLFPLARIAKFFVPFTSTLDPNMRPRTMFDSYPSYIGCAKTCLTMMFRSWSGLFYFLHDGLPHLQTLMCSLAAGNSEMRDQILDLLFGLFPSLPKPHPATRDIDPAILGLLEALASCAPTALPVVSQTASTPCATTVPQTVTPEPCVLPRRRAPPTAWDIQGGFVAAEGCRVFPRPGSETVQLDLMESYTALLLATLIQAGLYEALIRAVSDSNQATSVRAGLLLGLLAYRACVLLPPDHPSARRLHQAGVLRSTDGGGGGGTQLAVLWLERVHRVMHAHDQRRACPASLVLVPIHSPFLECLARQSRIGPLPSTVMNETSPVSDGSSPSEAWIDQIISQSGVVPATVTKSSFLGGRLSHTVYTESLKPPDQWDWELLTSFGRLLSDSQSMISWDRKPRLRFLQRLMDFFTPSSWESASTDREFYFPGRSSSIPNAIPDGKTNAVTTAAPVESMAVSAKSKERGCSLPRGPRSLTALSAAFGTSDNVAPTCPAVNCGLASLPYTWPHAPAAGILLAGLIPHLALYPLTSEPGQLLTRFLSITRDALENSLRCTNASTTQDPSASVQDRDNSLFSVVQLSDTCSGLLILALGRLTASEAGESRLEASGLCATFQRLLLLTGCALREGPKASRYGDRNGHVWLGEMLLSSLDFTRPGRLGHQLITAAVNGACKPIRLYVVQLFRLLFRIQLPLLSSWCVDLLVKLCLDTSAQVACHAMQLLEEVCWDSVNVEALACHILPEPCRTPSAGKFPDPVTPFALRLLDPRNGPIGHRIFALVLSQSLRFQRLTQTDKSQRTHSDTLNAVQSIGPASSIGLSSHDAVSETVPSTLTVPVSETSAVTIDESATLLSHNPTVAPVHWLLDVARQYYNVAYACEVDTRLWSLFTSPTSVTTFAGTRGMLGRLVEEFQASPLAGKFTQWTKHQVRDSHVSGSSATDLARDNRDEIEDNEDDRLSDMGMRCTNRELFVFDETNSLCCGSGGTGGLYMPPALTVDSDYAWVEDTLCNFWSAPLPRHPYGCLAEHAAGLELLLKRGDLAAMLSTLQTARLYWIGTTAIPVESNLGKTEQKCNHPTAPPTVSVMETKAALWALAHVGSASCGQAWMAKQPGLIELYTQFATEARSMGLRAVAWLCLNLLISKSGGEHLVRSGISGCPEDVRTVPSTTEVDRVPWFSTDQDFSLPLTRLETDIDHHHLEQAAKWDNLAVGQQSKDSSTIAFFVNSVPISTGQTDEKSLFTLSSAVLPESHTKPNHVTAHAKPLLTNGLSIRKPLGRTNSSSWSHRTRRWLPRRWSPRRHKQGSSSPAPPSATGAANAQNSVTSGLNVAVAYTRHASIDSTRHPVEGPVSGTTMTSGGGPLGEHMSPTSSPEYGNPAARSCATWTHRDQWIHRDTVSALSEVTQSSLGGLVLGPKSVDPRSQPDISNHPAYHRAICLPADIQLLGRNHTQSMTNNGHCRIHKSVDQVSSIARQLSFVRIAAQAQIALDKWESAHRNAVNLRDTPTVITSVGDGHEHRRTEENGLVASNHDPENSKLIENDSLSVIRTVHDSNSSAHMDSVPVSIDSSGEEFQHNKCLLRVRSEPQDCCSSPTLSRTVDQLRCLSSACRRRSLNLVETTKQSTHSRDQWRSQLLEVITGLLANVFSTSHELALDHLVRVARRKVQLQSGNSAFDLAKADSGVFVDDNLPAQKEQLFDACVYTDVAQLLENYTFPLEARIKIQAAFLGLDLHELLADANHAVSELGQHLKDTHDDSNLENHVITLH